MWVMIGCSLLCLCLCLPLFFHFKPRNLSLAALFKSLGTLCALVPALISALRLEPVSWIFVAALSFPSGTCLLHCRFSEALSSDIRPYDPARLFSGLAGFPALPEQGKAGQKSSSLCGLWHGTQHNGCLRNGRRCHLLFIRGSYDTSGRSPFLIQ